MRLIVSLEVYDPSEVARIGSPYELKWATEGASEAQLTAASALLGVVSKKLSSLAATAGEPPEPLTVVHSDPPPTKEHPDVDPKVRSRKSSPRYVNHPSSLSSRVAGAPPSGRGMGRR